MNDCTSVPQKSWWWMCKWHKMFQYIYVPLWRLLWYHSGKINSIVPQEKWKTSLCEGRVNRFFKIWELCEKDCGWREKLNIALAKSMCVYPSEKRDFSFRSNDYFSKLILLILNSKFSCTHAKVITINIWAVCKKLKRNLKKIKWWKFYIDVRCSR